MAATRRVRRHRHSRMLGFTVVEILVVIGVIVLLAGILLPALVGVRKTGLMTKSMSNMRQIATWMRLYSTDNREAIVPSQFDYANNPNPGHVRTGVLPTGSQHQGSWADILWSVNNIAEYGTLANPGDPGGATDTSIASYRYDSPDNALYDKLGTVDANVLRSAAKNSRPGPGYTPGVTVPPRPFTSSPPLGDYTDYPGYFAANNYFNAAESSPTYNGWFTTGQIKAPDRSMYLVDSVAGEVIEDDPDPFDNNDPDPATSTLEVDFRYPGRQCLMLFLDGHEGPIGEWTDLCNLEKDRNIRVRDLILKSPPCP